MLDLQVEPWFKDPERAFTIAPNDPHNPNRQTQILRTESKEFLTEWVAVCLASSPPPNQTFSQAIKNLNVVKVPGGLQNHVTCDHCGEVLLVPEVDAMRKHLESKFRIGRLLCFNAVFRGSLPSAICCRSVERTDAAAAHSSSCGSAGGLPPSPPDNAHAPHGTALDPILTIFTPHSFGLRKEPVSVRAVMSATPRTPLPLPPPPAPSAVPPFPKPPRIAITSRGFFSASLFPLSCFFFDLYPNSGNQDGRENICARCNHTTEPSVSHSPTSLV